jgi:hypothetical protein
MALHYDWSKTPDHTALDPQFKYTAAMATAALGVGDISTDAGFSEYVMRLKVYEGLFGPLWMNEQGLPPGLSVIAEKARGLRTNVALEPRAKWFKRMADQYLAETRRGMLHD